ncbi:16S/23S rRNA (cytidine-2'-O)-methyltransferase TlyA isoform X2 [Prunus dulcis]|uniref:16S/23S rRNA (cytidine-2'-O)-methyltransferase TlyA isoform X2 n=1 Tax=Prunus dulcis TaxID=3755 RepID=UPI001483A4C8|nr:16S/23S rRNA (cytidine-2'-O)-methyltransferase TlyA isoform X2 [Prunus dulcis]
MALQLLKFPNHIIISRRFCRTSSFFLLSQSNSHHKLPARWVGVPIHRSFAAEVQPAKKKRRLDEVCLERYQQYSRTFIQSWIIQGHKLEAAIEQLRIDVSGKIALDSGLSTGGFTDCLLQYGASFVYGVDVGYGQVAEKIRTDERVSVIERTNLRHLPGLPQRVDLVTLDLSFISILLVMPAVIKVMKEESSLVTLVKPQFEARRSQVGSGGIVRDPLVHQEVLERIIKGVENFGFTSKGWIESPLKGAEGNTEFLVHFTRTAKKSEDELKMLNTTESVQLP